MELLTEESSGCCISCGETAEQVEPDAEKYRCDNCGENAVYGAEELLINELFHPLPEVGNDSSAKPTERE